MSRLVLVAALFAPIAGLAVTLDIGTGQSATVTEIRVPQARLQACRETLRALEARPVVTDGGTVLPGFLTDDDLPATVCVADA